MDMVLIAKRDMRYGTRRLKAGDYFEASKRDAKVLAAVKRADYAPGNRMPSNVPPIPEGLKKQVEQQDGEEIKGLREQYASKFGKRPYMGWDAETIRQKLAAEE